MYSAYKLNKQGDNIQPWHTPFPILNQSVVPCPVLTVASCPAYKFSQEADKVVCYSHLFKNIPQFVVIHTIKGFTLVKKAEGDVFSKFPCFFCDPAYVGNKDSKCQQVQAASLRLFSLICWIHSECSVADFNMETRGRKKVDAKSMPCIE